MVQPSSIKVVAEQADPISGEILQDLRLRDELGCVECGIAESFREILDRAGPLEVALRSGLICYRNASLRALYAEAGRVPPSTLAPAVMETLAWSAGGRSADIRSFASPRRTRSFSVRYEKLTNSGDRDLVVGFYEEVTQANELRRNFKRHRDRSQEFLSIVSDWVWEVDADWHLTHSISRAGETGFADLVGRILLSLGVFIDLPEQPAVRPPNMRTRAPFQDRPFRLTIPGETERIILLSAVPIFDDETGEFEGFRGAGRDVSAQALASERARAYQLRLEATLSELRSANARLDRALVEALAADRAKSSFLAMMGHELRTPLNAVLGFAEMLKAEIFGPLGNSRYVDYAADILGSGQQLLTLINDILDYVSVESGGIRLSTEAVEVASILANAVHAVEESARKGGLLVATDLPSGKMPFFCDGRLVLKIVLGLLSNAVKFTRSGGTVTISASIGPQGLTVIVADTGVGIAPEQLNSVLQPFQQGDGRLARKFEGAGLGLPLAKALAILHGGTLELRSVVDVGTEVTLLLPHAAAASAEPRRA